MDADSLQPSLAERPGRAFEVVLAWVDEQILSGDLAVGDQLPAERELARLLNVSRAAVRPLSMRRVDDLLGELARRDVELRVTPSLWPLRDAVLASSLAFSVIRMGNAVVAQVS